MMWGHEHKFAIISAFGRCIGYDGMHVELNACEFQREKSNHGDRRLVMVDQRKRTNSGKDPLGYKGYLLLKLKESLLDINYYDTEAKLLTETWAANLKICDTLLKHQLNWI